MLKEGITWCNRVGRRRVINGTRSCNVSKCKSCPKLPNVADGITRPRRAKRNRLPRSARARLLAHIKRATEPVHCLLPFHSLLIHWTSNGAYIVAVIHYTAKKNQLMLLPEDQYSFPLYPSSLPKRLLMSNVKKLKVF